MKIENLLQEIGLDFKVIDEENNMKIIKIPTKLQICVISQKGTQFLFEREIFEYLDNNSLPYCLLLQDTSQNKYFYLPLRKEVNWVKSCFDGCNKDKIFLGKQVLNAQTSVEEIKRQLSRYK